MSKPNIVVGSILDLIGDTPLVRLNRVVASGMAKVAVKLELFNVTHSSKDRIAYSMVEVAEREGQLKKGMTIVEPTSGNTGIGLAMVAAVKGYRVILTMPDSMSRERCDLLKCYGAELVLTPKGKGMLGAIDVAKKIFEASPNSVFMPQQFNNPVNPETHRKTTAVEILKATRGKIDAFVAGVGTGGFLTGVGEVLKKEIREVLVVAVEPLASNILSGGKTGCHNIQGIGTEFIPSVLNREMIDSVICVADEDAFEMAQLLARKEGINSGISGGANVFAALKVAQELGIGKQVVTMICDSGDRYFSVPGFFVEGNSKKSE